MDRVTFPGRLAFQQRVLPAYRIPFFDMFAAACLGGLSVLAGEPRSDEAIVSGQLKLAHYTPASNVHLFSGSLYLCYQRGLLDWLERWQPEALIAEANPRNISTPSALRWMKHYGKPVIGWGLGAPILSGPLSYLRRLRRLSFLRQFDALVAYSQRGAEEYIALGFQAKKVFTASNAAVPRPIHPIPSRPEAFTENPTIIFVGRLQTRKRIDLLLQACAALPKRLQPRLVIVGDGPESENLKRLSQQIYPKTEFPGALVKQELAPYLIAADLFVLPGTGGLAVQEAMSYALPVIVARGDGTQDDLVRPENGWQIPPDDLGALTDVLHTALSDSKHLRAMGISSYRIVAEEINLEKMVEVFMETLNRYKY